MANRGQPVASILDYSINDVAVARIEFGQAVIRYNPRVLTQMSEATRHFFYVHECAHHVLGHTIRRPSLSSEREADCWAINTMREDMGLSTYALRAIQNDFARLGRGDWTHLPGPMRAIDLEACLETFHDDTEDYNESEADIDACEECMDKCEEAWERCFDRCDSDSCFDRCDRVADRCMDRCEDKYQ